MSQKSQILDSFSNTFKENQHFDFKVHESSFSVRPFSVRRKRYRKHFFGYRAKWREGSDSESNFSISFLIFPKDTEEVTQKDYVGSRGLVSVHTTEQASLFVVSYLAMFQLKSKALTSHRPPA